MSDVELIWTAFVVAVAGLALWTHDKVVITLALLLVVLDIVLFTFN